MKSSLAINVDRSLSVIEERTDEYFYSSSSRTKLPMQSCSHKISDIIKENRVLLIIGETGSGKSTLLPQYLLNDPYWIGVCVAEPRRLAAVNLAEYICNQRNCLLGGSDIGYIIRYEQRMSDNTRLTFTTVGLLLRMFLYDPLLERYQLVMLDEIHERSVDMDLALALLKRVMLKRSDFRIVLASATPDVEQIKAFFGDHLAVLNVPGRQFQVSIYHVSHPVPDYVKAVYLTVLKLISASKYDNGSILCFLPGQEEIANVQQLLEDHTVGNKILIVPLYAALPHHKKVLAFKRSQQRKVILATSIAETSITLPDVTAEIDSGFTKVKCMLSPNSSSETLITTTVSWQEANQRAGRAGRVQPGICYRLYPKSTNLELFPDPEIRRANLTTYIGRLLALGIDNFVRFDMPTRPSAQSILSALDTLIALNIIDCSSAKLSSNYGERAVELPLDCKYSILLFKAEEMGCLDEMLDIVSAFQVRDLFTSRMKKLKSFGAKEGDVITLLNAMRGFRNATRSDVGGFCARNGLNFDALNRASRIRKQLEASMKVSDFTDSFAPTDIILRCLITGLFQNAVMLSSKQTSFNSGGQYESLVDGNVKELTIHKNSVFYNLEPLPQYLIYHTLSQDKVMFEVSVVRDVKWFQEMIPNYFSYGTERQIKQDE